MPEENMTIVSGKVVAIHYTLRDTGGLVLDDSGDGDPLVYLHGSGNIVPGLEDGLTGKERRRQGDCRGPAREGLRNPRSCWESKCSSGMSFPTTSTSK